MTQAVDELLAVQAGVISRSQALAAGLASCDVRRKLSRREWVSLHPGVYVNHTGEPTWLQRAWAAVLKCPGSWLCHESALRAFHGTLWRSSDDALIHVAIPRERRLAAPAGVRLHRPSTARVRWNLGPPRQSYEEAVLDVALKTTSEFALIAELADAVHRAVPPPPGCSTPWLSVAGCRGGTS